MGIVQEFKTFIAQGNVLDLAVGVVIGGAFGKIVTSFVDNVLMPPIGMLTGGINFSSLQVVLKQGADEKTTVALKYGAFIQSVFDFLIIAFAIFLVVKAVNRIKKKEAEAPAAPPRQEVLLEEIRDAIRAGR